MFAKTFTHNHTGGKVLGMATLARKRIRSLEFFTTTAIVSFLAQLAAAEPLDTENKTQPAVDALKKFTIEELHDYNGQDKSKPVLVALKGKVFDVTSETRFYVPGKPYAQFSGRDITRSTAMFSTAVEDLDRVDYPKEKEEYLEKIFQSTYVRKYPIVGELLPYESKMPEPSTSSERHEVPSRARELGSDVIKSWLTSLFQYVGIMSSGDTKRELRR
mmetsp:Transcript_4835/g.17560  ORF Transcript_4835/g.17560 Transcript_4835/m.17560 type:complete len:217 (+) Transcript_4835:185-835(+)